MTIQPGPELDRMVAEKVMGLKCAIGHPKSMFPGKCFVRDLPEMRFEYDRWSEFAPSSNIAHAWEVVERVTRVCPDKHPGTGMPIATVFADLFQRRDMWAETASDAAYQICMFALMAVGAIEVQ